MGEEGLLTRNKRYLGTFHEYIYLFISIFLIYLYISDLFSSLFLQCWVPPSSDPVRRGSAESKAHSAALYLSSLFVREQLSMDVQMTVFVREWWTS